MSAITKTFLRLQIFEFLLKTSSRGSPGRMNLPTLGKLSFDTGLGLGGSFNECCEGFMIRDTLGARTGGSF